MQPAWRHAHQGGTRTSSRGCLRYGRTVTLTNECLPGLRIHGYKPGRDNRVATIDDVGSGVCRFEASVLGQIQRASRILQNFAMICRRSDFATVFFADSETVREFVNHRTVCHWKCSAPGNALDRGKLRVRVLSQGLCRRTRRRSVQAILRSTDRQERIQHCETDSVPIRFRSGRTGRYAI